MRYFNLTLAIAITYATGCSYIKRNTIGMLLPSEVAEVSAPAQPSQPAIENQPAEVALSAPLPEPSQDDVQVVWRIPEDETDRFVVHYGFKADNLEHNLDLEASKVERLDHPKYGPVYRYILRGLPRDRTIFVSVSAVIDNVASHPSPAIEVPPLR